MDKVLAVLTIVGLIAFTGIVVGFVREPDLFAVVVMCILIAIHDFWTTFRDANNNDKNPDA